MIAGQTMTPASAINGHANSTKALLELESNTGLNRALLALLKSSFFDKKAINWKPVKYELVVNTKLTEEFLQVKNEFQSIAKESIEYEEKYGFLVESDAQVSDICQNGYSCPENAYNVIGQSKSGVYLCKYPDVNLKFAEVKKWPDNLTLKMVIFKICYGKQTLALVRKDAKLPPISATPNFNSHMSVIPPKEKDDIETQFDHSQVYLYELNNAKCAARRPRHCMPYAVITWLKFNDGTEWPQGFTEIDGDLGLLGTDSLEVALKTEDIYLQTKLKALLKNSLPVSPPEHLVNGNNLENNLTNGSLLNGNTNCNLVIVKTESVETNEIKETNEEPTSAETTEEAVNGIQNTEQQETETVNEPTNQVDSTDLINGELNKEIESTKTEKTTEENPDGTLNEALKSDPDGSVQQTVPPSVTPAATSVTAPAATTVSPSSSFQHHKTSLTHYNKPVYSSYRQNAAMAPYLYSAQNSAAAGVQYHPYGSIPYHARQIQQNAIPAGLSPYFPGGHIANPAASANIGQPQVFLVRGPNGLTYLSTGGPQQAQFSVQQQQQQMLVAQAQANALLQQQQQQNVAAAQAAAYAQQIAALQQAQAVAQASQAAATYAAAPTQYHNKQQQQQPQPQQQQQIIYQAAPQPAQPAGSQAAKANAASASSNVSTTNGTTAAPNTNGHAAPSQSPKTSTNANQLAAAAQFAQQQQQQQQQPNTLYATQHQISQINQMQQMAAAYSGQPTYFAYAPTGVQAANGAAAQQANGALASQQPYYAAAAAAGQQTQNFLPGQQAGPTQQQQQLQLQQLALLQQQQQQQAQQQQQNQQLFNYQQQLAAAGIGLNGFPQAGAQQHLAQSAAGAAQQLQIAPGLQAPAGYQLIDYRQLQATGAGIPLDQLAGLNAGAGVPRPRIINLRHHPYQRN